MGVAHDPGPGEHRAFHCNRRAIAEVRLPPCHRKVTAMFICDPRAQHGTVHRIARQALPTTRSRNAASGALGHLLGATLLAGAAISAIAASATPALAQAICGKRSAIVTQLQEKYGETRRSIGFQQGRGVVEVWASDDTGTWSIVVTNPQGITCLLAAGEAFESEAVRVADERPI